MPRDHRTEEAGAIHHVFARGNRAQAIFLGDRDRWKYLGLIGETVRRCGWRCLAYCLMTNHVHLVVETPRPNLGAGMQRLHGDYATWFNKRHEKVGHLFQGRYGAKRVADDVHLITLLRYLEANPVEAGLVKQPQDWPWCGAGAPRLPVWLDTPRLRELLDL